MPALDRLVTAFTRRPLLLLLLLFAAAVWIAGGASRGDVHGQAVIRAVSWFCLVVLILFAPGRPFFPRGRAVLLFLIAAAVLAAAQLAPLPPGLWASLPGRAAFGDVTAFAGGPAPWRPLAIVPGAALNALGALIVPFVALCFAVRDEQIGDGALLKMLLMLVVAGMFVGLLQFSGVPFRDPLINRGDAVGGTFANRNHFALLMACGLLLAPAWAFHQGRRPGWRGPVAAMLIPLLALAILASGSRAGMLTGIVALGCSLLMVRHPLRRALERYPRWVFPALIAAIAAVLAALVLFSVLADRAVSINRALLLDPAQDMRSRALPTVFAMIRDYSPAGSGLGGFDVLFRLHEPFDLLKPTVFNRAHDDLLEVVLDAGVPGLLLLTAALSWWLWMSVRAWRVAPEGQAMLPKLGSALLLIVIIASIVDYPARTPMMMVLIVIAGVWLSLAARSRSLSLPHNALPL